MHVLVVIPARIGSVRLPGKPLLKIAGEPLIVHVVRRVQEFELNANIVVATDDQRVADCVAKIGTEAVLTASSHSSGTERIGEVLSHKEFEWVDRVVNVQGDEPFVSRDAVTQALEMLNEGFEIATAAGPLEPKLAGDPNCVKVGIDQGNRALWFSRLVVAERPQQKLERGVYHHVGVYAYTRDAVLRWTRSPELPQERQEGLEQLRPLSLGMPVGVAVVPNSVIRGVDTVADLRRSEFLIQNTRTNA